MSSAGLAAVLLGFVLFIGVEHASLRQIALAACTFSVQNNVMAALWWAAALAAPPICLKDELLRIFQGVLVVQLTVVALVWHLAMERRRQDSGAEWLRNTAWHCAVPLLFCTSWLLHPRASLPVGYYMLYPALYCGFALAVGRALGWQLYWILDSWIDIAVYGILFLMVACLFSELSGRFKRAAS